MGPAATRKANVLVVDDNRANLITLDAVLGSYHNVIFAGSGAEAIAIVREHDDIDVVLMDVQMPEMDGFEAASRIKQLPGAADLPIIFITAVYSDDPYIKRGYEVGGLDYFTKPFDPELLKLKVRIYASFRRSGQPARAPELPSRQDLATALEQVPAGVLISDDAGRIQQMTDEAARVLRATDVTRHDVYGQLIDWWNGDGLALKEPDSPLDRALRKGESVHNHDLELRCCDGARRRIVVSVLPLRAPDGDLIGAVMVIRDRAVAGAIEPAVEEQVTRLFGSKTG